MLDWIAASAGTIVVLLILLVIVGLVIRKIVSDRRSGKSSCGCGCEHCAMHGKCHTK
ncbi:MAG: FeoB-associated Cys-rich membrane protein [Lachnospiraceae bacterium]|nr:FeoB-associated Cys-rich membrane protein [Lachnospiraceae bacterium]MBO7632039.1 FeoB-associated Cys-rich membrane protein [Lachnospiraceae bacterium]